MRLALLGAAAAAALVLGIGFGRAQVQRPALRAPETILPGSEPRQRSVALFEEAAKVITHPRCVNCHPATDRPLQGDEGRLHQPLVVRGEADIGVPGMTCTTCHGPANVVLAGASLKSMPGHPEWHLAPREMAWERVPIAEICRQIKDPARNGGRTLAAIHEHMAHDSLVGWGWNPGPGRAPAPGTQEEFGRLIGAWIETGAHCPG